jgi:hypothetical protein
MPYKRNRLSLRIPWMVEAVAEGPFAIVVLLLLVILILAAKGAGQWTIRTHSGWNIAGDRYPYCQCGSRSCRVLSPPTRSGSTDSQSENAWKPDELWRWSASLPGAAVALQESAIFLEQLFRVPGIRLASAPAIQSNPLTEGYELHGAIVACT